MPPHHPIAESPRLYLEPLSLSHLNAYHALNSDERISRWSNRPPTKDLSEAKTLLLTRLPSAEKPFMENYAVVLKKGNHDSKSNSNSNSYSNSTPHSNSSSIEKGNENEKGIEEGDKEEEEEQMIGVIGIPRLSPDGLEAEVGYAIRPEYWGMGYASEALILFRTYYFSSERPIQKETLLAETEPSNLASERVLLKAGFTRGKFVRDAFEVVDFVTGERGMRDATEWRFGRGQLG